MTEKVEKLPANKGFLGWIERMGNRFPHPLALFFYITVAVILISAICSFAGVKVTHPNTGELIKVVNLFSPSGLVLILQTFIKNFQDVPILGSIIVFSVACGFCERTGLFTTAIGMGLKNAKGAAVVFIIALIGCFSNQAGDVAFIIVPTIAAAIFIGMGRNPIVGIFVGYASVGCGYGTEIVPAYLSNVLTPVSVNAAKVMDPNFSMSPLNGYYFLFTSAIIVSLMITILTAKVIEPRFGTYDATYADKNIDLSPVEEITAEQKKGVKRAGLSVLIYVVIIVVLCIPSNSFFRGEGGTLLVGSPLMDAIIGLLVLLFFIPGIVYGISTKKIRNVVDLTNMAVESVKAVAPFIVLCLMIGQFLAMFAASNLATVFAIGGGELLKSANLPPFIILVLFIIILMIVDLFMISGTTKFLIFGPIFVPMFMQVGIHPALTQMAYRIGDCSTNALTPLNAAFLICLTMVQRYDKRMGMGNIFSAMIVYCIGCSIALIVAMGIWLMLGLPPGPTGALWISK